MNKIVLIFVLSALTAILQTEPSFAQTCSDTDAVGFETLGTCTSGGQSFTDECTGTDSIVKEYYCLDNTCEWTLIDCTDYCISTYGQLYTGACSGGFCACSQVVLTGPSATTIVIDKPKDGTIIRRGVLTLLAKGFEGTGLSSGISVTASSTLFGSAVLENNFDNMGSGIYGENVTLGKTIQKGDYEINFVGRKSSISQQKVLVKFDPTIYINTTLQNNYTKGERIRIEGLATFSDKMPVKNTTMKVSLSTSNFSLNKIIKTDLNGRFNYSYLLSFAEPDGLWNITLAINDTDGNEGVLTVLPSISTPEGVAYYVINFLNPLKDAEYKRGETIPITVEVREEGNLIENASVDLKTPEGEVIELEEVRPGTYVTEYTLSFSNPVGLWNIPVQAVKTENRITKAGGTRLPIVVASAPINLQVLEPSSNRFFAGQTIEVKATFSYHDGTKVENANVVARVGDRLVTLKEVQPGFYSGYYSFGTEDAGNKFMQITASDLYENSIQSPPRSISIAQVGLPELIVLLAYYNIVLPFWYVLVALGGWASLKTRHVWYKKYLEFNLERVGEEEKRIVAMEKEMQIKFFKDHTVNKNDYDQLISNYKRRIANLSEKKLKMRKSLKELKPIELKKFIKVNLWQKIKQ